MSEDQPTKKKAARKSARKKSAKKASVQTEVSPAEEQSLPLVPDEPKAEVKTGNEETQDQGERRDNRRKTREPKSKVRDARSESPTDEPEQGAASDPAEEKIEGNGEDNRRSDGRSEQSESDSASSEGRGRGRGRNRSRRTGGNEPSKPKQPVDEDHLKKKAWKIYLSEVTEEGLALLDDAGLRAFARGSFQAARVFLEEEQRHGGND
ncbi:MAG: hypothetical protein ACSHYF_01735 [Verrucomicrobiaceae bacterium]